MLLMTRRDNPTQFIQTRLFVLGYDSRRAIAEPCPSTRIKQHSPSGASTSRRSRPLWSTHLLQASHEQTYTASRTASSGSDLGRKSEPTSNGTTGTDHVSACRTQSEADMALHTINQATSRPSSKLTDMPSSDAGTGNHHSQSLTLQRNNKTVLARDGRAAGDGHCIWEAQKAGRFTPLLNSSKR